MLQLLLSPLLLWHSLLANALSVALYAGALAYYHYMNFLGYSALPFLEHTEVRAACQRRKKEEKKLRAVKAPPT